MVCFKEFTAPNKIFTHKTQCPQAFGKAAPESSSCASVRYIGSTPSGQWEPPIDGTDVVVKEEARKRPPPHGRCLLTTRQRMNWTVGWCEGKRRRGYGQAGSVATTGVWQHSHQGGCCRAQPGHTPGPSSNSQYPVTAQLKVTHS